MVTEAKKSPAGTALITGADGGIGSAAAAELASRGWDLILTARNRMALEDTAERLRLTGVHVDVLTADLSVREECFRLCRETEGRDIRFLVNNAGFGVYGPFAETELERELSLIDVNVTAVHILTKHFLKKMLQKGDGFILNVGSSAGFMAGPTFSSYYASKNYVVRLTEAVHEEMRREGSRVRVTALCPGPVETGFDRAAGVRRSMRGLSPEYVAKRGVDGALAGKMLVVPGLSMKLGLCFSRLLGETLLTRMTWRIQSRKAGGRENAEKR